ncbi:hypothetical protein [Streptomyces sp. NPDC005141]
MGTPREPGLGAFLLQQRDAAPEQGGECLALLGGELGGEGALDPSGAGVGVVERGRALVGEPAALRIPTTLVRRRGRTLVVRSQFDKGGPMGPGTPETPFTVAWVHGI